MTAPRRLVVATIVALFLVSCANGRTSRVDTAPRRPTSTSEPGHLPTTTRAGPPLQWRECDQGECADLEIPLDRTATNGPTIRLAVARGSRAKDGQKIGSLIVNPGGPGASGIDFVQYVATNLPSEITDRFDIVAWDTRGSGKSAPVRCGDHLDYLFDGDTAPDDAPELAALEAGARRFVDDCVAKSGDLLRHISTADTVQDLDALRGALGDERLTYLGLSYGTYIGGLYATTYPDHVRALVLDGALDPTLTAEQVAIEQAKGFDASLEAFFSWCTAHSDCAFHPDGDPRTAFAALARRIDARPIVDGDTTFGPTQLDIAVGALFYGGEASYRTLSAGLRELERGSASALGDAANSYLGRSDQGRYNDEWAAFIAISCADGPNLSVADAEALQRRAAVEAPEFGAANIGLGYECSYWPYPPTRRGPVAFHAPTAPPIVVVGTRGDPATPVAWARGLAAQLGNGRLVTVNGTSHTSSLSGNGCLESIEIRYLVDLAAPRSGAVC